MEETALQAKGYFEPEISAQMKIIKYVLYFLSLVLPISGKSVDPELPLSYEEFLETKPCDCRGCRPPKVVEEQRAFNAMKALTRRLKGKLRKIKADVRSELRYRGTLLKWGLEDLWERLEHLRKEQTPGLSMRAGGFYIY